MNAYSVVVYRHHDQDKPVRAACLVQALNDGMQTIATIHGDDRHDALTAIKAHLLNSIQIAELTGETLLAAKLCEALDVADNALEM
ncbi:MAG: hypothetical protein EOO77_31105 [Oxalobacteraceae bacterium]|nr:MAG: hypothetical protein EOO77_31105 [Oxalobacteraceae bacterium]